MATDADSIIVPPGEKKGDDLLFTTNQGSNNDSISIPPVEATFQAEFHFRSYGDAKFHKSKKRIESEATNTSWFKTVEVMGPADLPAEFTAKYQEILKLKRGGGYWIWKYPVIEETMKTLREGIS